MAAAAPSISLPGLTSLPPISAGGGQSSSALNSYGSLYHASGDGDWVVNLGGSGGSGLGFGGFGSASSNALGNSAGSGLIGTLTSSPLLLLALAGAAWFVLKK
jgi:hypothetical protein